MTTAAYALFFTFLACSLVLGWAAARLARRVGGPTTRSAVILPVLGAFGGFYLIGHRLGVEVGPTVGLFGFEVALLGDLAIGLAAALVVAACQAVTWKRGRRAVGA